MILECGGWVKHYVTLHSGKFIRKKTKNTSSVSSIDRYLEFRDQRIRELLESVYPWFVWLRERQKYTWTTAVSWISSLHFLHLLLHETIQKAAKWTCIKTDSKTQICRDPMRNPISFENIKTGSVVYWCTNCWVIDVSLLTFAKQVSNLCGLSSVCSQCVHEQSETRQAGWKHSERYPSKCIPFFFFFLLSNHSYHPEITWNGHFK